MWGWGDLCPGPEAVLHGGSFDQKQLLSPLLPPSSVSLVGSTLPDSLTMGIFLSLSLKQFLKGDHIGSVEKGPFSETLTVQDCSESLSTYFAFEQISAGLHQLSTG